MPRPSTATVPRSAQAATATQLGLEIPLELPALPLVPDWQARPRMWGPTLHPMCSYLASFPAALAHAFVARYSRPGDVVLDPFSGRGTTPLQAAAEGRIGVGNDLNPFAHLLTAAKVEPATRAESLTRLATLRLGWLVEADAWLDLAALVAADVAAGDDPSVRVPTAGSRGGPRAADETVPVEVTVAFHAATLGQLLAVRTALQLSDRVDRFMAAAISGILHGKTVGYLSPVMPNTFSMAPRYVREFVARTGYVAPERDLFRLLEAKLDRLYRHPLPSGRGVALMGDARDVGERTRSVLRQRGLPDRARLVVASPPYLRVVKYGYYNWLRTWFLGFDSRAIDAALDDGHRRVPYLAFLREVMGGLRPALADDAVIALVIGEVEMDRGRASNAGRDLAAAVWAAAAEPEGYRLAGLVRDDIAANRKMTKLWGEEAGRATKSDRILVLGSTETGRRRALAGASLPIDWEWPPRGLRLL